MKVVAPIFTDHRSPCLSAVVVELTAEEYGNLLGQRDGYQIAAMRPYPGQVVRINTELMERAELERAADDARSAAHTAEAAAKRLTELAAELKTMYAPPPPPQPKPED